MMENLICTRNPEAEAETEMQNKKIIDNLTRHENFTGSLLQILNLEPEIIDTNDEGEELSSKYQSDITYWKKCTTVMANICDIQKRMEKYRSSVQSKLMGTYLMKNSSENSKSDSEASSWKQKISSGNGHVNEKMSQGQGSSKKTEAALPNANENDAKLNPEDDMRIDYRLEEMNIYPKVEISDEKDSTPEEAEAMKSCHSDVDNRNSAAAADEIGQEIQIPIPIPSRSITVDEIVRERKDDDEGINKAKYLKRLTSRPKRYNNLDVSSESDNESSGSDVEIPKKKCKRNAKNSSSKIIKSKIMNLNQTGTAKKTRRKRIIRYNTRQFKSTHLTLIQPTDEDYNYKNEIMPLFYRTQEDFREANNKANGYVPSPAKKDWKCAVCFMINQHRPDIATPYLSDQPDGTFPFGLSNAYWKHAKKFHIGPKWINN